MNVVDAVQGAIKALVLPELKTLGSEITGLKVEVARQNGLLEATNQRIEATNQRIEATNQRIDDMRGDVAVLSQRVDAINRDLSARIDTLILHMVKPQDFAALRQRVDRMEDRLSRDDAKHPPTQEP